MAAVAKKTDKPIRRALPSDASAIKALLRDAGLPVSGVSSNVDGFVVFAGDSGIVAAGGVQRAGSSGLLRSVVVAPGSQGCGIATAICDRLENTARAAGIDALYLLTETAPQFFAHRGYSIVARSEAPAPIAKTEEFSTLCSQSAICMTLKL